MLLLPVYRVRFECLELIILANASSSFSANMFTLAVTLLLKLKNEEDILFVVVLFGVLRFEEDKIFDNGTVGKGTIRSFDEDILFELDDELDNDRDEICLGILSTLFCFVSLNGIGSFFTL
jgi:hypothetical protein